MKEDKLRTKPKMLKKTKKKIVAAICILLAIILVPVGTLAIVVNRYLSYIDYTPMEEYPELEINPEYREDALVVVPQEDTQLVEMFEQADVQIEDNIEDTFVFDESDVTNILLCGCDYGNSTKFYPRSDAMIIASINRKTKKISYVSLSRAAYVAIEGFENTRLNSAYEFGGPKLLVQTIENNYKIKIDHYVSVDFDGFSKLVDILGGVDIQLSDAEVGALAYFLEESGLDISGGAGTYHLDGICALEYSRLRSIDSDKMRTQRQRNVMRQLTYNARNLELYQLRAALTHIFPLIKTDMKKREIFSQGVNAIEYLSWNISEAAIPKKGTDLVLVNDLEVLILDWDEVRADIHEQLYP